jgi:hypothetical protein
VVASIDERHDFIVGFADALTRLAYLLTVTETAELPDATSNAYRRATVALAQAVRHWRDVHVTGAPEPIAVEALLNRLPRKHNRRATSPDSLDATPVTESALSIGAISPDDEKSDAAIELQRLHEAVWRAWTRLPERQRVPFLFAEVSPVSRLLDSLDVPAGFATPRRLEMLAGQAVLNLTAYLEVDRSIVGAPTVHELEALLADVLPQHAYDIVSSPDPYTAVVDVAYRARRRGMVAAALVIAVIAVSATVIANISTSRDRSKQAAASSAGSSASRQAGAVQNDAAAEQGAPLVNWPTRGTLKDDAALIAKVRSSFVADHIDATGRVQVLLVTDTTWYRVAYVAAQTRTGVLLSWFYGPPGSTDLVEGFFSYTGTFSNGDVVVAAVADTQGHDVLIVLGPPDTSNVLLAGADANAPLEQFTSLPVDDGVVINDISGVYVPALQVQVFASGTPIWAGQVPSVQLAATVGIKASLSVGAAGSTPASSSGTGVTSATSDPSINAVVVERGEPDPGLLDTALAAERQYVVTGTLAASGMPVVVWAGTDSSGTKGVLLRAKTLHLSDLLIAVWGNDPNKATGYRLAPDAPDAPIIFQYDGVAGASVGVLAPHGVTQVGLVVDGADIGVSQVDSDGFATLLVGKQYGVLAEQTLAVDLFDAKGRQISREPVTPSA